MSNAIRSRGDRYAMSALRNRRATLAAEIVALERQVRARKQSLVHVDATLKLMDPSIDVDAIAKKRVVKRVRLFRQGELSRKVLDALREAGRPLSTHELAAALAKAGGHGASARKAITPRVRGNLSYQEKRGKVVKVGNGKAVRWSLT